MQAARSLLQTSLSVPYLTCRIRSCRRQCHRTGEGHSHHPERWRARRYPSPPEELGDSESHGKAVPACCTSSSGPEAQSEDCSESAISSALPHEMTNSTKGRKRSVEKGVCERAGSKCQLLDRHCTTISVCVCNCNTVAGPSKPRGTVSDGMEATVPSTPPCS